MTEKYCRCEFRDSREGFDAATAAEYEDWLDTVDECDEEDWITFDES